MSRSKKSPSELYFEEEEKTITGLLEKMMLIDLSVAIGKREGREPRRVVENAKQTQRRLKAKQVQKSILRILAEKEQPFSIHPSVGVFLIELRHEELQYAMKRWPWIAVHEASKFA